MVIPAGRTFDEIIEKELNAAECIIVLWSRISVKSRWVRIEAAEGRVRRVVGHAVSPEGRAGAHFAVEARGVVLAAGAINSPNLLRASGLNFHGNIEGSDIYMGPTDVIVCDGFVGNVALKTSEGLAQMLGQYLREEFGRSLFTRLCGLLALPVVKSFRKRVDHRRYNGASLLGLRGIVVKSHGAADAYAFGFAIRRAYNAAKRGMLASIEDKINAIQQKAA